MLVLQLSTQCETITERIHVPKNPFNVLQCTAEDCTLNFLHEVYNVYCNVLRTTCIAMYSRQLPFEFVGRGIQRVLQWTTYSVYCNVQQKTTLWVSFMRHTTSTATYNVYCNLPFEFVARGIQSGGMANPNPAKPRFSHCPNAIRLSTHWTHWAIRLPT